MTLRQACLYFLFFVASAGTFNPVNTALAAPFVRVAVIDTGLPMVPIANDYLCHSGHKDFTNTTIADMQGHSTSVAYLIHKYSGLNKSKYCQVHIKFFNKEGDNTDTLSSSVRAIEHAIELKVDIINYSGGGKTFSQEEKIAVKKALNAGIIFVASAGNDGVDLDRFKYYPATLDERVIVVGAHNKQHQKLNSSNFSDTIVDLWEVGVFYEDFGTGEKKMFSGTSAATAVATGKIIKNLFNIRSNYESNDRVQFARGQR